MNSGRKKTAIYRNFIRTPKIISGATAFTAWMCVFYLALGWPIYVQVFAWIVATGFAFALGNWIGNTLAKMRFKRWASDIRGIHPNDFDHFLDGIDAETLEAMVSWDFGGIYDENDDEDEEEFLAKCEFGGPDDEVK